MKYSKLPSLILAILFSGCTSVTVEYDRMSGTAFPAAETDGSGEDITLGTIYLDGGLLLSVNEDDTNIATLSGTVTASDPNEFDFVTSAELDTIEGANRSSPVASVTRPCLDWSCTTHYVWGIVVDHFYEESDGTRRTDLMGLMTDASLRSTFANFYKHSVNSGENDRYLRSTAHEIGHAVNLNHCDGDGSTTIMNQTSVVGSTFSYEFSTSSLEHLQDHDRDDVLPGEDSRDYACPHAH